MQFPLTRFPTYTKFFATSPVSGQIWVSCSPTYVNFIYGKVASSRLSLLVAHLKIFGLFIQGKFDAYVLWPLAKQVQNWIVDQSTAPDFTVYGMAESKSEIGNQKTFPPIVK